MELLRAHVSRLLETGKLQEWHIWDFTRKDSDRAYIRQNYGPVTFIRPKGGYQQVTTISDNHTQTFTLGICSDLHVAVKRASDPSFTEFVLGGWNNSRSVIRTLENENFHTTGRSSECEVFSIETPGILRADAKNDLTVSVDPHGTISLSINGMHMQAETSSLNGEEIEVYFRGGESFSLEIVRDRTGITQFIGDIGLSAPYFQAFNFYAERYEQYRDYVFMKCDDDIVYIDSTHFLDYVNAIEHNNQYFLISANVVNNGICAYLQQQGGHLPESLGHFESPTNGMYGSLWESGYRANKLHEFYIEQGAPIWPLTEEIVPWKTRIFINFIGWRGENLRYMNIPQGDDEGMVSVLIPSYLKKDIAVFSKFMVSHLSFFPQEYQEFPEKHDPGKIDYKRIIDLYRAFIPK
nr:hypothetical protein [Gluconobacter cerinus]